MTSINIPSFFESPQNAALDAFNRRVLKAFKFALERLKADPNGIIDERLGVSIFKTILSEPNTGDYISLCIDHGADLYEVNNIDLRPPLLHAIDSFSSENLQILLKNFDTSEVNVKLGDKNCLHLLVQSLKNDNFTQHSESIKLLLQHGVDINSPDDKSKTPFYYLLKQQPKNPKVSDLVDFIVENHAVDLYNHRSDEMLTMFKTQNPHFDVPEKIEADLTFDFMRNLLNKGNEAKFVRIFKEFKSKNDKNSKFEENCTKLVYEAIKIGSHEAVLVMKSEGIDVNRKLNEYVNTPMLLAASYGYHRVLRVLIEGGKIWGREGQNGDGGNRSRVDSNQSRVDSNHPKVDSHLLHTVDSNLLIEGIEIENFSEENNFGLEITKIDSNGSKVDSNHPKVASSLFLEIDSNDPKIDSNQPNLSKVDPNQSETHSNQSRVDPNRSRVDSNLFLEIDPNWSKMDSNVSKVDTNQSNRSKTHPNQSRVDSNHPKVDSDLLHEIDPNVPKMDSNRSNPSKVVSNQSETHSNRSRVDSNHPKVDPTLLHKILHASYQHPHHQSPSIDHQKCFSIALPYCNINDQDDQNSTALHYAARHRNHEAVVELIRRNAFIGTKNMFNETPLDDLKLETLEEALNDRIQLIQIPQEKEQKEVKIEIDLNFLIPTQSNQGETESLEIIAKNPELRPLIAHPVLATFIFLKWKRLSPIFYANFAMFTILMWSFIKYIVMCHSMDLNERNESGWFGFFKLTSFLGIFLLIIREVFQFVVSIYSNVSYLKSPINIFEIFFIILALSSQILENSIDESQLRILRAFTILCAAFEFLHLFGELPFLSISCNMVILQKVALTFLKSLLLYSILLVAFALSFFILFENNGFGGRNGSGVANGADYDHNGANGANGADFGMVGGDYGKNDKLGANYDSHDPNYVKKVSKRANYDSHDSNYDSREPKRADYDSHDPRGANSDSRDPRGAKNPSHDPRGVNYDKKVSKRANHDNPSSTPSKSIATPSQDTEDEDEKAFNSFAYPGIAIIKTFVMLTGEFDAGSLSLHSKGAYYCIMFMLFIFMVTIVLFNLLSALAVDDTQKIKAQGELIDLCARIEVLRKYEKMIMGGLRSVNGLKELTTVFPHAIADGKVFVQPNKGYLLTTMTLSDDPSDTTVEIDDESEFGCLKSQLKMTKNSKCCIICNRLDGKIGKKLRSIIEERQELKMKENAEKIVVDEIKELKNEIAELKKLIIELNK